MIHSLIELLRRPLIVVATSALLFTPSLALAQFDEEGIGIGEGLYDEGGAENDNWFYDSYGGNYPGGYGNYGNIGLGEEEEEAEEGIYGGYEDYGGYYEEGELEEDDGWF
ncbi:hypothetical protein ACFOYU_19945 [Microvirga sp. GCM10011540]|uniref:hypothetical protein n=1 Tax=Microvirga sp. GCM10011540 TaxID=3317338 RepID=UPI00361E85FF